MVLSYFSRSDFVRSLAYINGQAMFDLLAVL